jgi:hypothetical protein
VDGRHQGAHVPHVGAAHGVGSTGFAHLPAQRLQVAGVRVRQGVVAAHRPISRLLAPAVLQASAGSLGPGAEAGQYPRLQLVQVVVILRPHKERGGSVLGNHVHRLAAVGDDAVDAGRTANVLAESADAVVGHDQCVQGVDPRLGPGRRVGRLAEVLHRQLDQGQALADRGVAVAGMGEHGHVQSVEGAAGGHEHLPARRLLRRRADDQHRAARLRQHRLGGDACPHRGGGDKVVAAAVPDSRQGIVLSQDGHPGSALAAGRPKGRLQAADTPLQGKALSLQILRQPTRGLGLLEGYLWVGVDLEAHID